MWHSNKKYSPGEIEVIRELEYDLFMFNQGFRKLWNDNFEDFFNALFSQKAWENKHVEAYGTWEEQVDREPELRAFLQKESLIDEVLLGDIDIKNVPIKVQEEIKEIYRESREVAQRIEFCESLGINPYDEAEEENENIEPLLRKADRWKEKLNLLIEPLHKELKNIDLFRLLQNYEQISASIFYALENGLHEPGTNFQWRPDRIGYTLALTSVSRCIQSFERLKNLPQIELKFNDFLHTAKEIEQELIDRLANIEQSRLHSFGP